MSKTSPATPKGFVTPFLAYLATVIKDYRYIILSTLVAGLAAHLFFLSHKLVTFDDTLFTYGQTISSGRWGLRILTYLMPPFSMPWFHGVISMLLMSAAFVVLVKMFDLRSRLAQVLLPAVIITCAVHTSIFLFMFTSTPYALAILLCVTSVYLVLQPGKIRFWLACTCLVASLSLYQVYITLVIALLIILLSLRLLRKEPLSRCDVMGYSRRVGSYLLLSLVVYFAIARAGIAFKGGLANSHADYAFASGQPLPWWEHITGVFTNFVALFTHGKLGLINTPFSVVLHLVAMVAMVTFILVYQWRQGSVGRVIAQVVLLLVALPTTIHLFWLLLAPGHWNTLTVYAFVTIYILAVALMVRYRQHHWLYDLLAVCLMGITLNNIYFDNRTYLQVEVQNANNFAFYNGLVTQIKLMPELAPKSQLALVGDANALVHNSDKDFGRSEIRGAVRLLNVYSRRDYIIRHIGFDIPILRRTDPEQKKLESDPRVQAMPVYPYHGSIMAIDSVIVVKLGPTSIENTN